MRIQVLGESEQPLYTHVVSLEPGEEVIESIGRAARAENIEVAGFTAIGGLHRTKLGFYNDETGGFDEIPLTEGHVEVLSLMGEITREDGEPKVHGHVVLGRSDGSTVGGHLLRGIVQPILIANVFELAHVRASRH